MLNYFSDDYNRFVGKYITIVYEYGSKSKKLHCKLLEYYENNLGEKFVILEASKALIYHLNCDNIIYLIAEYEDINKSNTIPIAVNVNSKLQSKELSFKQSQDIDTSFKENTSTNSKDSANHNKLKKNSIIFSNNKINPKASPVFIDEHKIISDKPYNNTIISDKELNSDKVDNDHKNISAYDNVLERYKDNANYTKVYLNSTLPAFINWTFHGVNLTICTTSGETISGEVVFNYDHLIVLKSDTNTYYINPEQIQYFY
jgi:hypothetical protein